MAVFQPATRAIISPYRRSWRYNDKLTLQLHIFCDVNTMHSAQRDLTTSRKTVILCKILIVLTLYWCYHNLKHCITTLRCPFCYWFSSLSVVHVIQGRVVKLCVLRLQDSLCCDYKTAFFLLYCDYNANNSDTTSFSMYLFKSHPRYFKLYFTPWSQIMLFLISP